MFHENVITAQGAELIRELLTGNKKLIFTRAVGGDGVCMESEISALSALPSECQTLTLTDMISGSNGPLLGVRVSSNGLQNAYTLRQIGVYAKLDDNETETLFQIAQDETGIRIPAQSETMGMTIDLSVGIAVDIGDAAVMIDSSAYVTTGQLQNALRDVVRTQGRVAFEVAPAQWIKVEDDGIPDLPWQAVISNELFLDVYVPHVLFDFDCLKYARASGISSDCFMRDNELILFAEKKPESAIRGECRMFLSDFSALNGNVTFQGDNGAWGDLFIQ